MSESAVATDLIEDLPDGPRLVGGRHRVTGKYVFPFPEGDSGKQYERVRLARTGTLWSWTVQRFQPKPPYIPPDGEREFVPYAVGYVELPEIIVESRIQTDDFASLQIGQVMELVQLPLFRRPSGEMVHTYAFRPAPTKGDRK